MHVGAVGVEAGEHPLERRLHQPLVTDLVLVDVVLADRLDRVQQGLDLLITVVVGFRALGLGVFFRLVCRGSTIALRRFGIGLLPSVCAGFCSVLRLFCWSRFCWFGFLWFLWGGCGLLRSGIDA